MADLISIQLLNQYRKRFGHGPPPWIVRELSLGLREADEVNLLMSEALQSGQPVAEWANPPEPEGVVLY